MKKPRFMTFIGGQQIVPAVFSGIGVLFIAQWLRIPASFFMKNIIGDDPDFTILSFAAMMFIIFIYTNLVAIWATLPMNTRGVWTIKRRRQKSIVSHPARKGDRHGKRSMHVLHDYCSDLGDHDV